MFLIIILVALVSSVTAFFISSRLNIMVFAPKYHLKELLKFAGYGTFSGVILICLFLLVLWLANKVVTRRSVSFGDFAVRPVSAMIPVLVFGIFGIIINFFTIYGTIMLFLTGVIMWIIMTYEALRSEWSSMSSTKAMYAIALSFFVFFVVVFNVLRLIV